MTGASEVRLRSLGQAFEEVVVMVVVKCLCILCALAACHSPSSLGQNAFWLGHYQDMAGSHRFEKVCSVVK